MKESGRDVPLDDAFDYRWGLPPTSDWLLVPAAFFPEMPRMGYVVGWRGVYLYRLAKQREGDDA